MKASEETTFNLVLKEIREAQSLTGYQEVRLTEIFGNRFAAAYRAVEEGKVKRYVFHPSGRGVWIVTGKERDYQILPLANFCSCFDFYFKVLSHEAFLCYHLIAQKVAEALERYVVVEMPDASFEPLMEKWREVTGWKRELSIAEVENVRRIAMEILFEGGGLPIGRLLDGMREAGFETLTQRHLVNILVADKAKRLSHVDGLWKLSSVQ